MKKLKKHIKMYGFAQSGSEKVGFPQVSLFAWFPKVGFPKVSLLVWFPKVGFTKVSLLF